MCQFMDNVVTTFNNVSVMMDNVVTSFIGI